MIMARNRLHSLKKFLGRPWQLDRRPIIVDAGTFNGRKGNKYPMLSEPRPAYHGIKPAGDLWTFCRRDPPCGGWAARNWPRAVAVQRVPSFSRHRDLAAAHAEALRQRQAWRNPRRHAAVAGVRYAGIASDQYTISPQIPLRRERARVHLQPEGRHEAGVKLVSN